MAHPDIEIRLHWIEWFKKFIDLTIALGASSMGSLFGIFTAKDDNDLKVREKRRQQNIDGWHHVGEYAAKKGLSFLSWEPMSISREQGETIKECARLNVDVNNGSPIPFKLCLDVDHKKMDTISNHMVHHPQLIFDLNPINNLILSDADSVTYVVLILQIYD